MPVFYRGPTGVATESDEAAVWERAAPMAKR